VFVTDVEGSIPSLLPITLTPRSYIVSVKHGDDTVLLNVATGRYYSLNLTGTLIWQWLCESVPPAAMISKLEKLYDLDPAVARSSVTQLLRDCAAASLFQEEW